MTIFSNLRNKLEEKKRKMQEQMQRGREVTEQMRAERLRKKIKKVQDGKPSAVNTLQKHLMMKTMNPLDVMKDEYNRRRNERSKH